MSKSPAFESAAAAVSQLDPGEQTAMIDAIVNGDSTSGLQPLATTLTTAMGGTLPQVAADAIATIRTGIAAINGGSGPNSNGPSSGQ